MKIFADLEIHSKFSRAVSREMTPENIDEWSRVKGLNIVGTGDFTHPVWFSELKQKLEPVAPGLFQLKKEFQKSRSGQAPYFLLSGEISCVYSKGGKVRKVHNLIFTPDFEKAEKIIKQLSLIGNLKSDGRPIIGLDSKKLLKILLDISEDNALIPAHVWTPWFGVFGSKSGFDSLEECFDELTSQVFAIETGLSSDPAMNWRMSWLDNKAIVSFSDPHSLHRLGREATVFDIEPSYFDLFKAIKEKNRANFLFTVEFFPEGGRYHFDGHRLCGVSFSPEETKDKKGICPVCAKPLTIGVLNRIEELASRPENFNLDGAIPFKRLYPLDEIIAASFNMSSVSSKKVQAEYLKLVKHFNSEYFILLEASEKELAGVTSPEIVHGIVSVRQGNVKVLPGYDGEYGKLSISGSFPVKVDRQTSLF